MSRSSSRALAKLPFSALMNPDASHCPVGSGPVIGEPVATEYDGRVYDGATGMSQRQPATMPASAESACEASAGPLSTSIDTISAPLRDTSSVCTSPAPAKRYV